MTNFPQVYSIIKKGKKGKSEQVLGKQGAISVK